MKRILSGIPSHCENAAVIVYDCFTVTHSVARLFTAGLTVLIMLLFKRHYSLATATQLDWILAPTAKLVSWSTSAHLVLEIGVGYVDFAKGIIVAPACAGINFMIMAFGLTVFSGLRQIRRLPGQVAWLILALAAAYGLTLVVNTMRIALSMILYDANIYTAWLTPARVHRLAGVGLYLSALWLTFLGSRQVMAIYCGYLDSRERHKNMRTSCWLVSCWYLLVALAVPLANRAWRQDSLVFGEHCVAVLIAGVSFCVLITVISRVLAILHRGLSERARLV